MLLTISQVPVYPFEDNVSAYYLSLVFDGTVDDRKDALLTLIRRSGCDQIYEAAYYHSYDPNKKGYTTGFFAILTEKELAYLLLMDHNRVNSVFAEVVKEESGTQYMLIRADGFRYTLERI